MQVARNPKNCLKRQAGHSSLLSRTRGGGRWGGGLSGVHSPCCPAEAASNPTRGRDFYRSEQKPLGSSMA